MPLYGIDISHHQGTRVDLARARREGFDFAIFKATEGSTFVDSRFAANLAAGRKAGLIVAGYHFLRSGVSASAQLANVKRVVPKDVPLIPDVELIRNSEGQVVSRPSLALTREFIKLARAAGYTVPLLYLPRWYWDGYLGSPSLKGLPPLWSSRYVTSRGYASEIYEDVPDSYWDGYGGNTVAVLQYSSSATVAGYRPVDVNAYRGDRDELAALFNEEDDMPTAKEIAEAVWEHPQKNNITGELDAAGTLLRYGHSHSYNAAQALPALLDDEAKLSALIREVESETDPAVIETAFYNALKRVLREGSNEGDQA